MDFEKLKKLLRIQINERTIDDINSIIKIAYVIFYS